MDLISSTPKLLSKNVYYIPSNRFGTQMAWREGGVVVN
jgi:hypothetical protein